MKLIILLVLLFPAASFASEMVFRVTYPDQEIKEFAAPNAEQKDLPTRLKKWKCSYGSTGTIPSGNAAGTVIGSIDCHPIGAGKNEMSSVMQCLPMGQDEHMNKLFSDLEKRSFALWDYSKNSKGDRTLIEIVCNP